MTSSNIVTEPSEGLHDDSLRIGQAMARRVFDARGNHSEIHLSEADLATLLAGAAEVVRDML
jgi:hypothetical protein